MNSSNIFPNIWRFIILVAIQALVLKQIPLFAGEYFNILLYPLFIFFLPIEISTSMAMLLGFAVGLTVDMFYATPGLHASAGVFGAVARRILMLAFEPKGGYNGKEVIPSAHYFGWAWFSQVSSLFFIAYLFWYFSVDAFHFVYFGSITLKTLASWLLSMIFVIFYGFMFNPKR
jgi:hypothetical protein